MSSTWSTILAAEDGSRGMDVELFRAINGFAWATPWLHGIVYGFATYGVAVFAALLLLGWWVARRSSDPTRASAALWAASGTLLAVGLNQPIVTAVHETRPYATLHGILVLADRSSDFSFPSDHATMAGAVAAGLFLVSHRLGWVATAAAGMIAFARIYIAAHYPQDVIAGLVFGAAIVLLGWLLVRRPLTAGLRLLQRTALRRLIAAAPETGVDAAAGAQRTAGQP